MKILSALLFVSLSLKSISAALPKIERREPRRGSSKSYFRYEATSRAGNFGLYGNMNHKTLGDDAFVASNNFLMVADADLD